MAVQSSQIDSILQLISQEYINKNVLMVHDVAREQFRAPGMTVASHEDFKHVVTSYVQHHLASVGEGSPTAAAAFGEAKGILDRAFNQDRYQEGYARALQMALDGDQGGMRAILNEIADALRSRALVNHMDHVFYCRRAVCGIRQGELWVGLG